MLFAGGKPVGRTGVGRFFDEDEVSRIDSKIGREMMIR